MPFSPSPRTSVSSQANSSRPMLETPSPDSSMNHGSTSQLNHSGRRLSSGGNPFNTRLEAIASVDDDPDSRTTLSPLNPPSAPFARETASSPAYSSASSREGSPGPASRLPSYSNSSNIPILGSRSYEAGLSTLPSDSSNVSLSVNYLPSKFSSGMLNLEAREGARRRRGGGVKGGGKGLEMGGMRMPKMGGGREAFRAGEARMAGDGDEDEDDEFRANESVDTNRSSWAFWRKPTRVETPITPLPRKKMRWNRFKWILFACNTMLTVYSASSVVVCLLVWFDAWTKADIVRVGNTTELSISTVAALMGLFTSLIGWAGLLMNNRMFLAIYTFLCWITFIFLVVPGYLTYKKRTFNLEGKINAQWSRNLGAEGRLRIQNQLNCCGYFSPFVEATVTQTCYARSILPGCKKTYMEFEDYILKKWYIAVFSLVPFHIIVMTAGLLCSNHVTYRFGKGMMPKAYRLSLNSMAVIMDQYAQQLADQYGADIANDIITRSKAGTPFESGRDTPVGVPTMPYMKKGDTMSSAGTSVTKVFPAKF
ncbi:hypothetical protein MD484_g1335, partial [Candolleomyces efflorescens]